MPAYGRRRAVIAAACFALGVVGYEFWPRDETSISKLLNELCSQLNQTRDQSSLDRLRRFLRGALTSAVDVRVAELNLELSGIDEVSARAQDLLSAPPLSFAWSSVEVHSSKNLARVEADLWATVRGSGEQHRDLRRTGVRLVKIGSNWQIEAIDIAPVPPAEPEARP